MSRRAILTLLVCAFSFSLLFASAWAAPVRLSVYGVAQDRLDQYFGEWAKANDIVLESVSGFSITALAEEFILREAAGLPIDVARVDPPRMVGLGALGLLEDLTPWVDQAGIALDSEFQPGSYFNGYGPLWAIPTEVSTRTFFYNPDAFANAGLSEPPADFTAVNWTWDEFVATLQLLTSDTNGDGVPEMYGLQPHFGLDQLRHIWDAHYLSEDYSSFTGTKPALVDALQKVVDLRWVYGVTGGRMASGTAAMAFSGQWEIEGINNSGVPWNLTVPPFGTQREVVLYINGLAMSKSSKNKEAAWKFIEYVTTDEEGIESWIKIMSRIPSSKRGAEPFLRILDELYPGKRNFLWGQAILYGQPDRLDFTATAVELRNITQEAWWNVAFQGGGTSILIAMEQIRDRVNLLLQEHREFLQAQGLL